MGFLRDIYLNSSEPIQFADMLQEVFELTFLNRDESRQFARLTDGYMNITVGKPPSHSTSSFNVDHLGFYVDDLDASFERAAEWNCPENKKISAGTTRYFTCPDGWDFEVRAPKPGWEDGCGLDGTHATMIRTRATLYRLAEVPGPPTLILLPPITTTDEDGSDGFVRVADVGDLPVGSAARVEVNGVPILVVNVEGSYFAVLDRCPHKPQMRLSDGGRQGSLIECPGHGSQFDIVEGTVLCPPARRAPLAFEVRVIKDEVWLELPTTT